MRSKPIRSESTCSDDHHRGFGGPEVFQEKRDRQGGARPNEVLVRCTPTSINPVDYRCCKRLVASLPRVIATTYRVWWSRRREGDDPDRGDEVYYTPNRSVARQLRRVPMARADIVARKRATSPHAEAAAVPLAAAPPGTHLVERARVRPGETVLEPVGGARALACRSRGRRERAAGRLGRTMMGRREAGADSHRLPREDFAQVVRWETDGAGVDVVFARPARHAGASIRYQPHGRMGTSLGRPDWAACATTSRCTSFPPRGAGPGGLRALIERGALRPLFDSILTRGPSGRRTGDWRRAASRGRSCWTSTRLSR